MNCIAIISPGDMGHAIGRVLRERGLGVITCLAGRSERTRSRSTEAGIREVASYDELVREADLIFSILVPANAVSATRAIAAAMRRAGRGPYFADCNAVSPATVGTIAEIVTGASGRFIDASIIGFPPAEGVTPRLYVSGPHAQVMSVLNGQGIEVVTLGDEVGAASAIKMCYASVTKGTFALYFAAAAAAEKLGLFDEFCRELAHSQPAVLKVIEHQLPRLVPKTLRWAGEMEEIAGTFDAVGVTPLLHQGAADTYRLVSQSIQRQRID
jgi:3-hydroxyisobutyrate dehydrogenase-like beta-hydroxyacid dehydrogenase